MNRMWVIRDDGFSPVKRRLAFGLFPAGIWLLVLVLPAALPARASMKVRQPVWAGRFYPARPAELRQVIAGFMGRVDTQSVRHSGRPPRALVMPHAGYIYCGRTAAHAACLLPKGHYKRVILIGPDHRVGFDGVAVSRASAFASPLGRVYLDPAARRMTDRPPFKNVPACDISEHSLEVVLPWLQYALGDFRFIPLVMGRCDPQKVAAMLAGLVEEHTLVVVSSDLSHYLPYDRAVERDHRTLDAVVKSDTGFLLEGRNRACGRLALVVLMELARKFRWHARVLHYSNSGDSAGDRSAVVGYGAVAYWGEEQMEKKDNFKLTPQQGRTLVKLARQTLLEKFGMPAETVDLGDPVFQRRCGTFVTLTLGGQLRGCIGTLEGYETLGDSVRRNAVNAAFNDPRFAPLSVQELDNVHIEVSVLGEPRPLAYSDGADLLAKLRPGIDGVIISLGAAGATFLPQVWDQLPDPRSFLSHLCMKAGLPADQWRKGKLQVKTYQVQYFEEPR